MKEKITSLLKNVRHTLHAVQEEIKDDLTAEEIELALKYRPDLNIWRRDYKIRGVKER